jgi:hypothetical protein
MDRRLLFIAAALVISVGALWLGYSWLRVRKTAAVLARLAPALAEFDEFFALVDLSGSRAHFLERHGPMLKSCEVLQRAETGRLDVSGYVGKPVASARWFRHADLLRAVASAAEHWASGTRPNDGRFVFDFGSEIGEGFLKGGGAAVRTSIAVVIVRGGEVLTAYPLLTGAIAKHALTGADVTSSIDTQL